MAALDVIVGRLVLLWRKSAVRRNVPLLFLLISSGGSVLKDLEVVPETYFSSSQNVFNLYFVKISWGWTLLLLTPFLVISNSAVSRSATFLGRRLLSLVVATIVWYVCTETFFYIEEVTGACFGSDSRTGKATEHPTKASCREAGLHWYGYDISGHAFILTYSSLLIVEETAAMGIVRMTRLPTFFRVALSLLYVALNLLVLLWVWMFTCTSVYFHDMSHKLLGTLCGMLGWFLTYRVWYRSRLSPGQPPQLRPKDQSQSA